MLLISPGAMSKAGAVLGSLAWLVLAPGTLTLLVPWLAHPRGARGRPSSTARLRGGSVSSSSSLGLPVLVEAFARFALQGRGTPVPLLPTERLVVSGFYRFVRNPMYVAVTAILVGEALWLGSPRVMAFALVVWAAFHAFVLLYEEPNVRRRFGPEYERYRAAVPRWIPRLRPWKG